MNIESAVTIYRKGEAVSDAIISTVNSFAPTVGYFDAEQKNVGGLVTILTNFQLADRGYRSNCLSTC